MVHAVQHMEQKVQELIRILIVFQEPKSPA